MGRFGLTSVDLLTLFFFFNDTATPEIYTLSLHDALPISSSATSGTLPCLKASNAAMLRLTKRSEEHTSELQSHVNLVCRLLLEKKKRDTIIPGVLNKKKKFHIQQ